MTPIPQTPLEETLPLDDHIMVILGSKPSVSAEIKVGLQPKVKFIWNEIIDKGFPAEEQKQLLENYVRKGDLHTEAQK